MNSKQQFSTICKFIRANGQLVRKAQSCWGADRWEIECEAGKLVTTVEDEGYTQGLFAEGLGVRSTCGENLKFEEGSEEVLENLFAKILKLPLDISK